MSMKILVCIPHFYNRTRLYESTLGSSLEPEEQRAATVAECLQRIVSLLSDQFFNLRTAPNSSVGFTIVEPIGSEITGDVVLCVNKDNHLLERIRSGPIVKVVFSQTNQPRHLGYLCREVFLRYAGAYDLYCFIEDDHLVLDDEFFEKAAHFYKTFGEGRIFLPRRLEVFGIKGAAWKAYIDDGAPQGWHLESERPDVHELRLSDGRKEIVLEKTNILLSGASSLPTGSLGNG
jgi:hypothetical protein